MKYLSLTIILLAALFTLAACGGDDAEEANETAGCTSLLDALTQCMDGWCAGDGAANIYCGCYESGEVVRLGQPCTCAGADSWRASHRALHCIGDLPDNAGAMLDCEGTKAALASSLTQCG